MTAHPDQGDDITKPAPGSGFPFPDLKAGMGYTFRVIAKNSFGSSPISAESTRVVPAGPPVPGGTGAAAGLNEAYVHWAPANPNGGTLTGYTVTASPGGATKTLGANVLDTRFTGLSATTNYTFVVTAVSNLASALDDPSNSVRPYGVASAPDAPTGVSAVPGSRQATVKWAAPVTHGAQPTGYTITASPGGAQAQISGTAVEGDISGLTNGTDYTFRVVANSVAGSSPASASTSARPVTPPAPGKPRITDITTTGTSATVSFRKPTSGGAPTSYTISSSDGKSVTAQSAERPVVFNGFSDSTNDVVFSVRATNDGGTGEAGESAPINIGPPDRPQVFGVPGNGTVGIRWDESHEFGRDVDHYIVEVQKLAPCSGEGKWPFVFGDCLDKVKEVPKGPASTYHYEEEMENDGGCISFVVTAVATNGKKGLGSPLMVCEGTPNAPVDPTFAVNPDGTATLTWTAPSGGVSQPAKYAVYSFSNPDEPFSEPHQEYVTTGTTYEIKNQKPGVTYRYRIVSINAAGEVGPYSTFATIEAPQKDHVWGIDSVDPVTPTFLNRIKAVGQPDFFGRYIDGAYSITNEKREDELAALRSGGVNHVLLFTVAYCVYLGSPAGTEHGNDAVENLHRLGVPDNNTTLINLDIEGCGKGDIKVDSAFLTAWANVVRNAGYIPGLYTTAKNSLHVTAVCGVDTPSPIRIWHSSATVGRKGPDEAPMFEPVQFPCADKALSAGWQFGIPPCLAHPNGSDDLGNCIGTRAELNVDTDITRPQNLSLLWKI